MATTYFTFGIEHTYSNPHPTLGPLAVSEGWWEVMGPEYNAAVNIFQKLFGTAYAFSYDEANFDPEVKKAKYYPAGCLRRIEFIDSAANYYHEDHYDLG